MIIYARLLLPLLLWGWMAGADISTVTIRNFNRDGDPSAFWIHLMEDQRLAPFWNFFDKQIESQVNAGSLSAVKQAMRTWTTCKVVLHEGATPDSWRVDGILEANGSSDVWYDLLKSYGRDGATYHTDANMTISQNGPWLRFGVGSGSPVALVWGDSAQDESHLVQFHVDGPTLYRVLQSAGRDDASRDALTSLSAVFVPVDGALDLTLNGIYSKIIFTGVPPGFGSVDISTLDCLPANTTAVATLAITGKGLWQGLLRPLATYVMTIRYSDFELAAVAAMHRWGLRGTMDDMVDAVATGQWILMAARSEGAGGQAWGVIAPRSDSLDRVVAGLLGRGLAELPMVNTVECVKNGLHDDIGIYIVRGATSWRATNDLRLARELTTDVTGWLASPLGVAIRGRLKTGTVLVGVGDAQAAVDQLRQTCQSAVAELPLKPSEQQGLASWIRTAGQGVQPSWYAVRQMDGQTISESEGIFGGNPALSLAAFALARCMAPMWTQMRAESQQGQISNILRHQIWRAEQQYLQAVKISGTTTATFGTLLQWVHPRAGGAAGLLPACWAHMQPVVAGYQWALFVRPQTTDARSRPDFVCYAIPLSPNLAALAITGDGTIYHGVWPVGKPIDEQALWGDHSSWSEQKAWQPTKKSTLSGSATSTNFP